MRSAAFRDWLGKRRYAGAALTAKGVNSRVRKLPRIERGLEALGFEERDLDTLHANGRWPDLVAAVRRVAADWRAHEAAARRMAPQAADPTRQLGNLINAARQYGHFADGKDPNYDADVDEAQAIDTQADEIDEAALDALKARFLAAFPDFDSGGGFGGRSGFHDEEDDYKRALIDTVHAALDRRPALDDAALGGLLLDGLDKNSNLLGYYRTNVRLREIRARHPGRMEAAAGALARSTADPAAAAEEFLTVAWPLLREGSEANQPYGESRIFATVIQALARPTEAISVIYQRFHNLGMALLGRPPFGNNPLTAPEYRGVLDLAGELFAIMEDWGWRPRDLWDVQGFVWVACKEKPNVDTARDADRIRQYALDIYIAPARARGDASVTVRAGDVHTALGMTNAHANVCQALRGAKFQEMASVAVPSFTGPDNSSTTVFTYALSTEPQVIQGSSDGPYWFVGASFGRVSDQFDRFLTGGFWEIDNPGPKHREQVLSMRPGQRIAIKATFVRRLNLPFDNKGRPVSVMAIKVVGTITHNPSDGAKVSVDWARNYQPREWYHYTYQPTIWEVYPAKEMARRLIAFAFDGAEQDYDWFIANMSNWRDPPPGPEPVEEIQPDRRKKDPQNIILYGPPGTGKTYATMTEAVRLCLGLDANDPLLTEEENRDELRVEYERLRALGQIAFVTFHQNFAYEDFIEGREPKALPGGTGFELATRQGLFVKAALRASDSDEEHVLIIDEINRANISKVFGELITLIEPDKRKGMPHAVALRLPYSQEEFSVPANLHLVGTMNTADRSIALLDTALRRRFVFREIAPDASLLPEEVDGVPLRRVLDAINDRIEYLVGRDHRIGHAFFMGDGGKDRDAIDATMRDKVIPLLQEYFFEDWGRVATVLGEPQDKGGGFLDCRMLADPTGEGGEPRASWSVRKDFAPEAYDRLVSKPAAATE